MFNNLVRSISKTFQPTRDSEHTEQSPRRPGPTERQPDRIDDDFLLVGQTASEKTTIYASQFDGRLQAPPDYTQIQRDDKALPNYQEYVSNTPQFSPLNGTGSDFCGSTTSHHQGAGLVPAGNTAVDNTQNTGGPLSDIPFKLGPCTNYARISSEIKSSTLLVPMEFDNSLYSYDFETESSFLRAHSSDDVCTGVSEWNR